MRALLVEDERRIASDISRALEASGYVVDMVSDGEDAWFRGDAEDYGVVILDLGLPAMDGLAVLKRWRANGRRMPVLVLTAREAGPSGSTGSMPAPTIICRSPSRWRNCWRGCARSCAAPQGTRRRSSRRGTSGWTSDR